MTEGNNSKEGKERKKKSEKEAIVLLSCYRRVVIRKTLRVVTAAQHGISNPICTATTNSKRTNNTRKETVGRIFFFFQIYFERGNAH